MTHWISVAVIEPDVDMITDSKTRSGVPSGGSWRDGAILTLIEPEVVFRRSLAGAFEDIACFGSTVMSIDPDDVVMERRSCSMKAP